MEWSGGVESKGGRVEASVSGLVSPVLRKKGSGWNGMELSPTLPTVPPKCTSSSGVCVMLREKERGRGRGEKRRRKRGEEGSFKSCPCDV